MHKNWIIHDCWTPWVSQLSQCLRHVPIGEVISSINLTVVHDGRLTHGAHARAEASCVTITKQHATTVTQTSFEPHLHLFLCQMRTLQHAPLSPIPPACTESAEEQELQYIAGIKHDFFEPQQLGVMLKHDCNSAGSPRSNGRVGHPPSCKPSAKFWCVELGAL